MIYIIIPVFNRLEHTRKCLESLDKQMYKNYKIILIDDGSTDGTYTYVKEKFPSVTIVQGNGSWWWTKSTNEGIKFIIDESKEEDFILTLNNDLTVNSDYIEKLIKVYETNKPCVIGSTSLWKSNIDKIDFVGVNWNAYNAKYTQVVEKRLKYTKLKENMTVVKTDLLPGRGTMFPVSLIKKIGFYDERNFPQYAADEDFSLRAKSAGYELLVSVEAIVISDVESTGINFKFQKPSIKIFFQSLISIRSANNLKIRYKFAKKHTQYPRIYFLYDVLRLLGSFVKQYIKAIIR